MHDNRFPSSSSALQPQLRSVSVGEAAALPSPVLPHHRLIAWSVAKSLLAAGLAGRIRDAQLRDEAVRSAK